MIKNNIIVALFIFTSICYSDLISAKPDEKNKDDSKDDSKDEKPEKNKLSEIVEDIANTLGDSKLSAAIEMIKNLKTEESTTIGSVQKADVAFYELNTKFDYAHGACLIDNIDKLFNLWLNEPYFSDMPPFYKRVIALSIKELMFQLKSDPYMRQQFSVQFQDGRGTVHMIIIALMPHNKNPDAVFWSLQTMVGGFVPARDWVIITHTKSSWLKSERTDEIVYLPPVMKREHFEDFLAINKQMLIDFYNVFVSHIKISFQ